MLFVAKATRTIERVDSSTVGKYLKSVLKLTVMSWCQGLSRDKRCKIFLRMDTFISLNSQSLCYWRWRFAMICRWSVLWKWFQWWHDGDDQVLSVSNSEWLCTSVVSEPACGGGVEPLKEQKHHLGQSGLSYDSFLALLLLGSREAPPGRV